MVWTLLFLFIEKFSFVFRRRQSLRLFKQSAEIMHIFKAGFHRYFLYRHIGCADSRFCMLDSDNVPILYNRAAHNFMKYPVCIIKGQIKFLFDMLTGYRLSVVKFDIGRNSLCDLIAFSGFWSSSAAFLNAVIFKLYHHRGYRIRDGKPIFRQARLGREYTSLQNIFYRVKKLTLLNMIFTFYDYIAEIITSRTECICQIQFIAFFLQSP